MSPLGQLKLSNSNVQTIMVIFVSDLWFMVNPKQ